MNIKENIKREENENMEQSKKRKINTDDQIMNSEQILKNQEQLTHYIFQIGHLCESTVNTLNTIQIKLENMDERIKNIEKNSIHIQKINHTFFEELKSKDQEILLLQQMNQNMIKDYENKIQIIENQIIENKPKDDSSSYSFYS